MTAPPIDEPERDAWLSEALRHAPDAQAGPPAALSEAILRQARAATRSGTPVASRPSRGRLAAVWAWLGRPPVAAGFASVTVAVLVGVMWWDRPLDDTLPPPVAATAPTPLADSVPLAPAQPPAAAPEQPAPATASNLEASKEARRQSTDKPPIESAKPKAPALANGRFAQSRTSPGDEPASTSPPPPPALQASPPPDTPSAEPLPQLPLPQLPPVPAPTAAAPVAPAPRTTPPDVRALTQRQRSSDSETNSADRLSSLRAQGLSPNRPAALSAALAAVPAEPDRWTYRRGGDTHPMTPALQAWLARLDRATAAARWTVQASQPTAAAAPLVLLRDGVPALTLSVADGAVWVAPNGRAELPAGASELDRGLREAAP